MEEMQRIVVEDRIRDLRQEAVDNRTGRRMGVPAAPRGTAESARSRAARWLIGIGRSVAGRSTDCPPSDAGMASPV
jgi:hypothetical protein